jgi:hypothetical protein
MNDIRANLTAPRPQGVLDDIAGGETNLLPAALLDSDLQVKFDAWPNSDPSETSPETLQLYWDGALVKTKVYTEALTESNRVIDVPKDSWKDKDGGHIMMYIVDAPISGESESHPTTVTIDSTAPALAVPDAFILPDSIPMKNGVPTITKAFLDSFGEAGVPFTVPHWPRPKPKDKVLCHLEWSETPSSNPIDTLTVEYETIGNPVLLRLTATVLDQNQGEGRYLSYRLADRAGNISGYSTLTKLNIDLSVAARNLPAVKVVPF